ncbi:MAG: heme A synthase, partial [Halieaceae bacterium]|nr:heme A synthase [Halieaceae bacterium]
RPVAHTALSGLSRYARWSPLLLGLVYLMILSGALVAGTRAGLVYPTWPLMGDSFVPPGLYTMTPAWLAAFEDVVTIQFNHRMFAYLLFVVLNVFAFLVYRHAPHGRVRSAAVILAVVLWMQVLLGISTLLQQVPVWLGAAHQGGAVLLLTAMLYLSHCVMRPKP